MLDTPLENPGKSVKKFKKPLIRSFGRIKSRKFSDHKKSLFAELLPKYELAVPKYLEDENAAQFNSQNCLEIGFGFGDFLFGQAKTRPNENFFGCEPHLNGVVNLLAKLEQEPLSNLKLSKIDIRLLLPGFPPEFFSEIFILFPDPWPKSKHQKRRLINTEFLDDFIAPRLESKGKLVIATDHDSYKTWILSQILASKKFYWTAQEPKDWQNFPPFWIKTKYQRKAEEEGRISIFIELIKL